MVRACDPQCADECSPGTARQPCHFLVEGQCCKLQTHERRLRFVLRARELGFSLDEIRELLRLVYERDQPCAEERAVATAHFGDVRAKIADLKRMERVLKDEVAQCADGTLPECPLIETLFREGTVN